MDFEFKVEKDSKGDIHVKPIIEKKGNDVIVHLPSFKLMQELNYKEQGDKCHGIRHIQSI